GNGEEAIQQVIKLRPDIVLMDVRMPVMDGVAATRAIMSHSPTPIVVMSTTVDESKDGISFQAVRAGALMVVPKPVGATHHDFKTEAMRLQRTLRSMSTVRVIHHHPIHPSAPVAASLSPMTTKPQIVGIVSSTGGPGALSQIVEALCPNFALPIVIVQHMSKDFIPSLADWLRTCTPLQVEIARHGDVPKPGCIYLAPGGTHLRLNRSLRFNLEESTEGQFIPSGDIFLQSVAAAYQAKAVGIILTGMGSDGVSGLRQLYESGALTIAQSEETSVVFGMPQEAIQQAVAREVLSPVEIAARLNQLSA
ncbi:MAG TPA: chemotaxis protein CheB, partial [Phototrophicaceae bacterium]|nr:chemotaxis protein CheB [Phototrophicaceae bacterium]